MESSSPQSAEAEPDRSASVPARTGARSGIAGLGADESPRRRTGAWATILVCVAVGGALAAISRIDYVAFHLIIEVAVVVVLSTMFAIAWHTSRVSTNGYLTFLGMAALPIAVVTLLHALTYRGMPVIPAHTTDMPTQLWLVSRYITVAGFLVAPAFAGRRLERQLAWLAAFSALALILVASIFVDVFPHAFIEGRGLTAFKVTSEYAIVGGFALALGLLWRRRAVLPADVFRLLVGALATSILAELLFTTYSDVYGITNMLGHLTYLLSFYLLYRALIDVVLERPYEALFGELAKREAALRETHRFSEGLNEIDAAINSTLDSDEIFRRVVEMSGSILRADAAVLGVFEGDRFRPKYFWGYSGSELDGITLDRDSGRHIFRSWEIGMPLSIADTADSPYASPKLVEATGVRAILANVLALRGQPIGALGLHWLHGPHAATDDEIDFVRKVTSSLALAVENALSYAGEHEIAEALQTSMASAAEGVTGVDVGHVYVPAPGPGRIGGDFFDLFALDDTRLAFLVGDVAGRGLAAAATNASTRSIVRALAYVEPEPGLVLQRASNALVRQLGESEFVTAAFGVLDTTDGSARIAIFGHPDPLVAGRDEIRPPDGMRCPPLAISSEAPCAPWELTLEPGDTLVLYTDGVLETRAKGEFFGSERLREIVDASAGSATAQAIADSVLDAVREFAGGSLTDDLAILAIRYVGRGASS